jgi:uncharacterized protein YhbP (UPF0306 family)
MSTTALRIIPLATLGQTRHSQLSRLRAVVAAVARITRKTAGTVVRVALAAEQGTTHMQQDWARAVLEQQIKVSLAVRQPWRQTVPWPRAVVVLVPLLGM